MAPVLEAAEQSSVLSSEEEPHTMDQDCRVIKSSSSQSSADRACNVVLEGRA